MTALLRSVDIGLMMSIEPIKYKLVLLKAWLKNSFESFQVVSALLFYLPRACWLMMEGGLMKFLAKGATDKIIEDADAKRDSLLKTFQVTNKIPQN